MIKMKLFMNVKFLDLSKSFKPVDWLRLVSLCCFLILGGAFTQAHHREQEEVIRPRVFINPGHGGHDSDDRYEPFYNEGVKIQVPYYESDSNLNEGNALADILREKGYEVYVSRMKNTTDDDLSLFEISQLAQNSGADVFFAIHSNDTGTSRRVNFPLGLYRGYDNRPVAEGSDELSRIVTAGLYGNEATCWSSGPMNRGDWSFYNWGYGVGLGVLRWNKLPGMLVESSFHDYLPERERLLNKDYSWLESFIHSCSMDTYFKRGDYDRGVVAGIVRYSVPRRGAGCKVFGDDALQPVNGQPVELCDPQGNVLASYVIDNYNNGFYLFGEIAPGIYSVEVDGVESHRVEVKANEVTYCNIMIPFIEEAVPVEQPSLSNQH